MDSSAAPSPCAATKGSDPLLRHGTELTVKAKPKHPALSSLCPAQLLSLSLGRVERQAEREREAGRRKRTKGQDNENEQEQVCCTAESYRARDQHGQLSVVFEDKWRLSHLKHYLGQILRCSVHTLCKV